MAYKFNKVKSDAFKTMQFNAGILLSDFDPTGATEVDDADIISATTGGINATCVPTFVDLGEDVDNAPLNTKELKDIESYACQMTATLFGVTAETIKLSIGAADIEVATGKVTPRSELTGTDFNDIWWVGDLKGGGMVAIQLVDALSDSGFAIQTTKNGKGQLSLTMTGHSSIATPTVIPMNFWVADAEAAQ